MPGLDTHLGLSLVEAGPDRVVQRWTVRPEITQPYGIVHGGTYCTAVESSASVGAATTSAINPSDTHHERCRSLTCAIRHGDFKPGRRKVWRVTVTDDQDRLVAQGQVRLQNLADSDRGPGH